MHCCHAVSGRWLARYPVFISLTAAKVTSLSPDHPPSTNYSMVNRKLCTLTDGIHSSNVYHIAKIRYSSTYVKRLWQLYVNTVAQNCQFRPRTDFSTELYTLLLKIAVYIYANSNMLYFTSKTAKHHRRWCYLPLGLCRVTRLTRVLDSKSESSNFLLLEYSHRILI